MGCCLSKQRRESDNEEHEPLLSVPMDSLQQADRTDFLEQRSSFESVSSQTEQAVRNDSSSQTEQAVRNDSSSQTEEAVRNDSSSQTEQAVRNDSSSQTEQAVRNDSSSQTEQAVRNDSSSQTEETVRNDSSSPQTEQAVGNDSVYLTEQAVGNDSVYLTGQAVRNDSVYLTGQAVRNDSVYLTEEAVRNDSSFQVRTEEAVIDDSNSQTEEGLKTNETDPSEEGRSSHLFRPHTTHYISCFAVETKTSSETIELPSVFRACRDQISTVLHKCGVSQVGKIWSTPGCGVWLEVTFLSDRKLKTFLQSKKNLENELTSILSQRQSQDTPIWVCETSTELYLLGPDLPEKIRKVTLANFRSSSSLFAKSKVFELPGDAKADNVAAPEDTLVPEDLSEMINQLAEVADWYLLGVFLKVPPHRLKQIEQDIPPRTGSTKRRCCEVLLVWMEMISPEEVKWSTLVTAVANLGMWGCAQRIASEYGVECPAETSSGGVMSSEEDAKFQQTLKDIEKLMQDQEANTDQLLEKQQLLERSRKERVVKVKTLQSIKETLSDTVNKAKALSEEKVDLNRKLAEKEHQLREKEREMEQLLQIKSEGVQKEVRLLEANIADLRSQVSDIRHHLKTKEEELRAAKEEINNVNTQLNQRSAELSTKTQAIQVLEKEQHLMEVQLTKERLEVEKCRNEVVSIREVLMAVKEEAELRIHAAEQQLQLKLQGSQHQAGRREAELLAQFRLSHAEEGSADSDVLDRIQMAASVTTFQQLCSIFKSLPDLCGRMELCAKTITGRTVNLTEVEPYFTIDKIKCKIQEKEGIPQNQQRLLYAGKRLEDGRMLCEYDILSGSTINLVLSERLTDHNIADNILHLGVLGTIQISVKILCETGYDTTSFEASTLDTVDTVKARIQESWGVPPYEQVLKCAGEDMRNGTKLSKYKIKKDTTVYLLLQV